MKILSQDKLSTSYLDEEDLVIGLLLEERGLLRLQLNPLQSERQLVLRVRDRKEDDLQDVLRGWIIQA